MLSVLMMAAGLAGLTPAERNVANCMVEQIGQVGASSSEPFDTILRVADARCASDWDIVRRYWHAQRSFGAVNGPRAEEQQLYAYIYSEGFEALQRARR